MNPNQVAFSLVAQALFSVKFYHSVFLVLIPVVKDTVGKRKSRNKKRLRRLVKKHKSDDQFFSGSDTDMALWDGENEENLPCSSTRKDTCLAIGVSFGMEMTDIEANGGTGIGKNTLGEKVNAASAIESVR